MITIRYLYTYAVEPIQSHRDKDVLITSSGIYNIKGNQEILEEKRIYCNVPNLTIQQLYEYAHFNQLYTFSLFIKHEICYCIMFYVSTKNFSENRRLLSKANANDLKAKIN